MPPLTEAQRKLRSKSIGSSDASWIWNRKKWPLLYRQKVEGFREKIPMRRQLQMDCGHALEPIVMKWLTMKGEKIVAKDCLHHKAGVTKQGAAVPLSSRADCFIQQANKSLGVEIKSTFWRVTPDVLLQQYYAQIQHHMLVWDRDQWEFAFITMNGVDFFRQTVQRNDRYIENYLDVCNLFWNFHVVNRIPPEEKK